MASADRSLGHVLVTGGCGFLGHHVVAQLLSRHPSTKVSVVDITTSRNRSSSTNVSYHTLDFTDAEATKELFSKLRPNAVVHTASPHFGVAPALMHKVNVDGTNVLLDAAKAAGVKAFVYTSSASVIFDWRTPLQNADERWSPLAGGDQPEYYTSTKAWAEAEVLAANRTETAAGTPLLTCSLRPSGIFGEGDGQMLPALLDAYRTGKTRFQIGDNVNLFDFTYVGNAATAHVQAVNGLLRTATMAPTVPLDTERVDGEAFFVTNDQPVYFWDFTRAVWREAGDTTPIERVWTLPWEFIYPIAFLAEWICWMLRLAEPKLTRQKLRNSTLTRYFNIDKARRRLAYNPVVTLDEGIQRSVKPAMKELVEAEQRTKEGKKRQ